MPNDRTPVIVSAVRTAIGSFGGTLSTIPAPELGAVVIRAAVERAGIDPAHIDEVLMGCVVPAGLGQAPARLSSSPHRVSTRRGESTFRIFGFVTWLRCDPDHRATTPWTSGIASLRRLSMPCFSVTVELGHPLHDPWR